MDQSKKEAERAKVIQEINATQADYENAINEYKKYDFKKIKEEIEKYGEIEKSRQDVDKRLSSLEKEKELHEGYKQELVQLQAKISHYDESIMSFVQQHEKLQQDIITLRDKTDINQLDKIE